MSAPTGWRQTRLGTYHDTTGQTSEDITYDVQDEHEMDPQEIAASLDAQRQAHVEKWGTLAAPLATVIDTWRQGREDVTGVPAPRKHWVQRRLDGGPHLVTDMVQELIHQRRVIRGPVVEWGALAKDGRWWLAVAVPADWGLPAGTTVDAEATAHG